MHDCMCKSRHSYRSQWQQHNSQRWRVEALNLDARPRKLPGELFQLMLNQIDPTQDDARKF